MFIHSQLITTENAIFDPNCCARHFLNSENSNFFKIEIFPALHRDSFDNGSKLKHPILEIYEAFMGFPI